MTLGGAGGDVREADAGGSDGSDERAGRNGGPPPRTTAERATLAASVFVVVLLVGAALYAQFVREEPAGVRVEVALTVDEAEARDGMFYVPFTVTNDGDAAVASVTVAFEVKRGEEVVEESTTEIAFLPRRGSAEGELVTALDPAAHVIEARIASVQAP